MHQPNLFISPVFKLGPITITNTVVTTWGIIGTLLLVSWIATRHLKIKPGPWQVILEGIVSTAVDAISAVLPDDLRRVLPFISTLWIFILTANLMSVIPHLHSPTGDLSLTAALAVLVFLSVHWFGIRIQGLKNYLLHYVRPNPLLFPFHIISEISRTIALAVRLFGNMFSLEMAALLILMVGGLLIPVPVLMLHIVEALVQAYIFGMLALIYIAGGIQSHQQIEKKEKE
ncbi:MAG: F0F1 ATP synthase subunit A [Nitrospiria bacterium]